MPILSIKVFVGTARSAVARPRKRSTVADLVPHEYVLKIDAGSSLIDVVRRAEAVIKMAGQINANGVGSTGKSSPDAAAPSVPHVGSAGNAPL